MNDAWDPIEDLEPLDDTSLGLLASYRDAAGPCEDAEARMLAGLRARLSTEGGVDVPATAVPPETTAVPAEQNTSSNARSFAVAAIAFAAGVALTVSLGHPKAPDESLSASNGDAEQLVHRDAAGASGRLHPETYVPQRGAGSSDLSVPGRTEPVAGRSWPLSFADLANPQLQQVEPVEGSTRQLVEPRVPEGPNENICPPPPRPSSDDVPRGSDPAKGTTTSHGPFRGAPDPAVTGRGTAIQGAWAPSVSGTPAGAGIDSAARDPAVAGPSPTAPNADAGSSNAGGDGSSDTPSDEPPPADEPPPSDEPDEPDEPDQERPLEEVCSEQLDACLADADAYCAADYPGCDPVRDFCFMRSMTCLDEDGGSPYPGYPGSPTDGPKPENCDTDYDICVMETDTMCMLEKLGPDDCEQLFWYCDELMAMCYGEPPPEPW